MNYSDRTLTCTSCKLLFSIPELHHAHYKTDWHRFNVKRKTAGFPPVSEKEYEKRAALFAAANQEKERVSLKCTPCNKYFSSENAMANHVKSKKHLEAEATEKKKPKAEKDVNVCQPSKVKVEDLPVDEIIDDDEEWPDSDSDWESCDDEDEEDITRVVVDTHDCLFCDHQSDSTENNVSHMMEKHSFFIPHIERVSDLDSLIGFLAGKIHVGHLCLWCNGDGKEFKSVKAAKQHMVDKGHCKMLYEGNALVDYADFYDFTPEVERENFDEIHIANLLEESDYELVLPSGSTVGHRSLAQYYKQNLKPVSSDNEKKVKKVLQNYRALGYVGSAGPAGVRTARDMIFMQTVKSRYNLKLGVRANKLQHHFRSQVMF